jgi:hypothetical protein
MDAHHEPGALDALIQDGLAMQVGTTLIAKYHYYCDFRLLKMPKLLLLNSRCLLDIFVLRHFH